MSSQPKVYKKGNTDVPDDAVYIGRSSPWGNPHRIKPGCTRKQSLIRFRMYVANNPGLLQRAQKELKGRSLVCHCKPRDCHGDIWIELLSTVPKKSLF